MQIRQSGGIPLIHRLVTSEHGENYWFCGCARYVMECLKEPDYDYWFFAGLTGDALVQHYRQPFSGDGVNAHHQFNGDGKFFEDVFAKCGYNASFVFCGELVKNRERYIGKLISLIDSGTPVITLGNDGPPFGVFIGYENYGRTLLYITGDNGEPQRIDSDKAMESNKPDIDGWIFVGNKREQKSLAQIYRDAVAALPKLLGTDTPEYCFGSAAFYKWADDVENGYFDGIKQSSFDMWSMYTNFVCVLATNAGASRGFLKRALELNPDLSFLDSACGLYGKTEAIWHNDNGNDLEALGGGFNITLDTLQNPEKRTRLAARLRECGRITDEIAQIIKSVT